MRNKFKLIHKFISVFLTFIVFLFQATRYITDQAVTVRDNLKEIIGNEFKAYGGSISLDCWTDKCRKATYFGLTLHYISYEGEQLKLNDRVLVIRELLAEKKDGDFLKEKVLEYLIEFDLMQYMEDKVVFVSDRGSNIVKALHAYNHINCFAHMIHNCVEKMLDELPALNIVTAIVKYFKSSGHNASFDTTLKSYVSTRWNSVFRMLESFIEHWDAISRILSTSPRDKKDKQEAKKKHLAQFKTISRDELILLRDFLRPFKTATDEIEATLQPTLYLLHPWYHVLLGHMQPKVQDPTLIAQLKIIGHSYWTTNVQMHVTQYHDVAVFLHPSMKNLKLYTDREKKAVWDKVNELINGLPEIVLVRNQSSRPETDNNSAISQALNIFLDDDDDDTPQQTEIEVYKNMKIKLNGKSLLQWWEEIKLTLPNLYKIARFIHSIPASSAAAERLFSKAGRMVAFRPNMRSELVDEVLFLKSNFDLFSSAKIACEDGEVSSIEASESVNNENVIVNTSNLNDIDGMLGAIC